MSQGDVSTMRWRCRPFVVGTMTRAQAAQLKKKFLAAFERHGNVTWACRELGIERRRVYDWKDQDEVFAGAFADAEVQATETMEQEAYRRAVEGTTKGVYHNGHLIDTVHEYSDTLMIFMLKARNPEKYRENVKVTLVTEDDIRRVAEDRGLDPREVSALAEKIANGKA